MRRLARPSVVYTAAILAGGIALVSAIETWAQLQSADPSNPRTWAVSDWLLSVALPAVAIAAVVTMRWLQRRMRLRDVQHRQPDPEQCSELTDDESFPSTWTHSAPWHRQARRRIERGKHQSAAS